MNTSWNSTHPWPPDSSPTENATSASPQGDGQGRFLTGNSGGGRPKGSRNKLTETLISAVVDDFAEHGAEAIAHVRAEDPAMYLRIVSALVPRELIVQREQEPDVDYADLSDTECNELLQAESRRRLIEIGLEIVRNRPHLIDQK